MKVSSRQANQVQTRVASGPRASNVESAAFGAPVAAGLGSLATAAFQIQKRADTASAESAVMDFETAKNDMFYNAETGFYKTQGRNAFDAAGETTKQLAKMQKDFGSKLSPGAMSMYDKVAKRHVLNGTADIARHASKGLKAWEVANNQAQIEHALEGAQQHWNNPKQLAVQTALGRQAIIDGAGMKGIDGVALNEQLENFESAAALGVIESAIASGSSAGKAALAKHGNKLEGNLGDKLKAKLKAKQKSEYTAYTSSQALGLATTAVADNDNLTDVIAQINEIKDDKIRKKAMTEANYQYRLKKRAIDEGTVNAFNDAGTTDESLDTWIVNNPGVWDGFTAKQQKSLEKGEKVETDWDVYNDLITLTPAKLKNVRVADYVTKLAPSHLDKLATMVKSANQPDKAKAAKMDQQAGRSRTSQSTDAVTGLYGKSAKRTPEQREQANQFYDMLDYQVDQFETDNDRAISSAEFTALVASLTREASYIEVGVLWNSEEEANISAIPAKDMPALRKHLRDTGKTVNASNLIILYESVK